MPADILNVAGANNGYLTTHQNSQDYAGYHCEYFSQDTTQDGFPARFDIPIPAYGRNMVANPGCTLYIAPNITGSNVNFYVTASYIDVNGMVQNFSQTFNIGSGGLVYSGNPDTRNGFRPDDVVALRISWTTSSSMAGLYVCNGSGGQLAYCNYSYTTITLTQPAINPPSGGYLSPQTYVITTTDPLDAPYTYIASSVDNVGNPNVSQSPNGNAVTGSLGPGFHVIQATLASSNTNPYNNNANLYNFSNTPTQRYWIEWTLAMPVLSLASGWYLSPPSYSITNPNVYDATANPSGLYGVYNNSLAVYLNANPILPSGAIPVGVWTLQARADCPGFYSSPSVWASYYVGQTLNAPSISVIGQSANPYGFYSGPITIQVTDNNPNHPNPILTVLDSGGAVLASTASRSVTLTLPLGAHNIQTYSTGQGAYQSPTTTSTFNIGRKVKTYTPGVGWVAHPVKVWNGTTWQEHSAKIWNGSSWS